MQSPGAGQSALECGIQHAPRSLKPGLGLLGGDCLYELLRGDARPLFEKPVKVRLAQSRLASERAQVRLLAPCVAHQEMNYTFDSREIGLRAWRFQRHGGTLTGRQLASHPILAIKVITMDTLKLLKKYKKVAVVGISANPERPSNWIARYLQDNGYEVTGVNPGLPKIEGIKVVASIQDVPSPLEIVDVFRSPDAIPALVDEVAPLKPAVFWLQPGAENDEAAERARSLGMIVVSGECIYAEHRMMVPEGRTASEA